MVAANLMVPSVRISQIIRCEHDYARHFFAHIQIFRYVLEISVKLVYLAVSALLIIVVCFSGRF